MSAGGPFPPGFRERVLRNTLYGIGGRMAGLVVAFLLTPYIVHRLGKEHYGLYSLAATVTGYLALLDLGLGAGYVKYVAEAAARDDHDGVNEVLSTGLYAYLAFGLVLLGLWALGHDLVLRALAVEPRLREEATAAFTLAVLVLALSGASSAFRAVLYGLQHIDVATRIGVFLIVPRVVLVLAALESGAGLVGLVAADVALFVAGSLAMAWAARRLYPQLSIRPSRVSRASLGRLYGYGVTLQVSRVSEMVNFHLDKVLLSRYVGLASVADYELATKILSTARSFPLLLVNAIVPAISELDARGASAGIERVAMRSLRYLLLSASALFGIVAFEAPRLVAVWLGPGQENTALAVRILALGYLLNVASGAFTSVTQGIARNEYQMRLALVGLTLNGGLSFLLVHAYGFRGVLVGTGVSLVAAYAYAHFGFRRIAEQALGRRPVIGWRSYAVPLGAAAIAGLASAGLGALLPWPATRAAGAGVLLLPSLAFVAVYLGALLALGGVEPGERGRLWRGITGSR